MSKSIAVIETPKSCQSCMFHFLKWHHPFWSNEKQNTKGMKCNLEAEHEAVELHIDDDEFKLDWCPLRKLPQKDNESHFPDEWEDGYATGWNACIGTIENNID